MEELKNEKEKNSKEHERLMKDMLLSHEEESKRIDNDFTLASRKLEDESKQRAINEENRHDEALKKIECEKLDIEKKGEARLAEIKLQSQESEQHHKERLEANEKELKLTLQKMENEGKKAEKEEETKLTEINKKLSYI